MQRRRNHGFTLIEILVVLVVIGLMAGAMVLMGSDNREAIARDEIEQLNAKLKLALEEAQLHGVEFGLVVTETDYRFVTFGNDRWTTIADDKAYQRHVLPDGFELALEIEGFKLAGGRLPGARITDDGKVVTDGGDERKEKQQRRQENEAESERDDAGNAEPTDEAGNGDDEAEQPESLLPQVFLLSSGELNPFVLAIGNRDSDPVFYRLRGNDDGEIKIEGPIRADPVSDLTIAWDNPDPNAIPEDEEEETDRLLDDDGGRKASRSQPSEKSGARDGGK
jgi:general secretion pathway protein H